MGGHVVVGRENDILEHCKAYTPQSIWWLVIFVEDGELKYDYILSSSRQQLRNLVKFLKELKAKEVKHLVFAIWHGQRRTDAFIVSSGRILEEFGDMYEGS